MSLNSFVTYECEPYTPRSLRRSIGFFCKFTLPSMARHRAFSNPRPGHPWPGVRALWSDIESLHKALTPALLARGGVHPQAIHGLWVKSSASCLAPRLRAGLFAADCDARRSQTGGTSTGRQQQKPKQRQKPDLGERLRTSPVLLGRLNPTPTVRRPRHARHHQSLAHMARMVKTCRTRTY